MKSVRKIVATTGLVLVAAFGLTACSEHYTDPSMVSLRYSGGLTEGGAFVECVDPGVKQVSDDTYYMYPTTQREDVWDSDKFDAANVPASSADQGDLEVTTSGGNLGYLKIKAVFRLETDCETLKEFHEKIGRTRAAYFNADGTYNSGWLWVMDNYITSAVVELAGNNSVGYTIDELWLDPTKRDELANKIEEQLQKAVNDRTEGDTQFFITGDVSIFKASPTDEFAKLYDDRKNAQVRAETAEANKAAQVAEAQAQTEVAREQAKARAAEIEGWGGSDAYLKKLAIDEGMNPYQPNYGTAPAPVVPAE